MWSDDFYEVYLYNHVVSRCSGFKPVPATKSNDFAYVNLTFVPPLLADANTF